MADDGSTAGRSTGRRALCAALAALAAATALAVAVSAVSRGAGGPVDLWFVLATVFLGAAFACAGCLVVAERAGDPQGPLLVVCGVALLAQMGFRELAYDGLASTEPATWERVLGWASAWLDVLGLPLPLALVLLLFPNGRLPSRRWRPVVAAAVAVGAVRLAGLALAPGPVRLESHDVAVPWRAAGGPSASAYHRLDQVTGALVALVLVVAAGSLVARYRGGDAETRQRTKPLAVSAAVMVTGLVLQVVPGLEEAGVLVFVAGGLTVPVALAVGVLRFRVWELDPLLVQTLVLSGLTVVIATLYVAVVEVLALALGEPVSEQELLPAVAATAAVAVLFAPVRGWLQRGARRLVLGPRASPYQTLVALPRRLVDAAAVDEVLPATAQTIALGLGAEAAGVVVRLPDDEPRQVWYPSAPDPDAAMVRETVRHLGVPVGELLVVPGRDRPVTRDDLRTLRHLAAQAGPALRSVALQAELAVRLSQLTERSAELTASRQRLAVAQSEERRRLQRDLHDGAQQRLVAVAVHLHAAAAALGDDPDAARRELSVADATLRQSLDEIRELSRGLHPSMLEARGLAATLRARAELSGRRVVVEASGLDGVRLDPAVESAAYFTCLEALQNAAKHAPDATVRIGLALTEDELRWSVVDDGPGFDAQGCHEGTGLAGIRERVRALCGEVTVVTSAAGTVVEGRLPRRVG